MHGGDTKCHLCLPRSIGATWRGGAQFPTISSQGTNECDAAILRNNSVLVSFRDGGGYRLQARSDDEGHSFVASSVRTIHALPDPGCQGSMVSAEDGTLYFSGPYSKTSRSNMTISRSTNDGNSWHDIANIWPSYAGYSSLMVMPRLFSVGGENHSLGIAYNRGWDGDGCVGDACPYSTVLTFTSSSTEPSTLESRSLPDDEDGVDQLDTVQAEEDDGKSGGLLLSFGWWRHRDEFPPDSPGLLDNHDLIVIGITPPSCSTSLKQCSRALNFTELIFGPNPQRLLNGSSLASLHSLVEWGRERFGVDDKFAFVQEHDRHGLWHVVVNSSACYMQQQSLQQRQRQHSDSGAHSGHVSTTDDDCGTSMKLTPTLCAACCNRRSSIGGSLMKSSLRWTWLVRSETGLARRRRCAS